MEATKQETRYRITLPADLMAILRWHAERLPPGPMRDSELLFPSETGGFRSPSALDKPFKRGRKAIPLGKRMTPGRCGEPSRTSPATPTVEALVRAESAATRPTR